MDLPEYFSDVSTELQRKSDAIRRDFATHHGAAGANRETLLAEALKDSIPGEFRIDTGLITSCDGQFSNQADLVIADGAWNTPFYPAAQNRIWLVEAIYALIEVKTSLTPTELRDALAKCRRFKSLPRKFSDAPLPPRLTDSLFILWAYEAPSPETVKANLEAELAGISVDEQPDFVVVPGKLVATSGSYREISKFGQPGSLHRSDLEAKYGKDLEALRTARSEVLELGKNSLLVWLVWFLSWLKRAGPRNPELLSYLPQENWGRRL